MGGTLVLNSDSPRLLPERAGNNLLFNSDIVSFLLKTNRGSDKKPNFIIFLECSALIVVEWWWRVAESCLGPAEIFHLGVLLYNDPPYDHSIT